MDETMMSRSDDLPVVRLDAAFESTKVGAQMIIPELYAKRSIATDGREFQIGDLVALEIGDGRKVDAAIIGADAERCQVLFSVKDAIRAGA